MRRWNGEQFAHFLVAHMILMQHTSSMAGESAESAKSRPGWYALLSGDDVDLDDWRHSLKPAFDPVAEKLPDGRTVLRSRDFQELTEVEAVRARALILIARMNGALAIWNGVRPVSFGGVLRIAEDGREHVTVFAEMIAFELNRCVMRATAVVLGPDGRPVPPPPPQPSQPQVWNRLADADDNLSDLLDQFGRADNWYDIYKTIEIAAHAVGGKQHLWRLLAPETRACRNLDQTANFYRHARGVRPPEYSLTLNEAKPLLAWLVRRILETRQGAH